MSKLSLCMIVKDEAWCLASCLKAAQGLADEVIVVDTGSTDSTREIALDFGARVLERPWDGDFSAPRNLAAEHATGDWILVLDADEVLSQKSHALIRYTIDHPGKFNWFDVRLWDAISIHDDPEDVISGKRSRLTHAAPVRRLYRSNVRWKNRVHEMPYVEGPACLLTADIAHFGNCDDGPKQQQKRERNLTLLQQEIDEHPENVFLAGYLACEHMLAYDQEMAKAQREKREPDTAHFIAAADVCEQARPHIKRGDESFRIMAIWGRIGCMLGDADECKEAGETGETVSPGMPDWAFYRGMNHYIRMRQLTGPERAQARHRAHGEFKECLARLQRLKAGIMMTASEGQCRRLVAELEADAKACATEAA